MSKCWLLIIKQRDFKSLLMLLDIFGVLLL